MTNSGRRSARSVTWLTALLVAGVPTGMTQDWGPTRVGVTPARQGTVQSVVHLPGSVEARTSAVVASSVAGVVAQVAAREGESVKRGATLVKLSYDTHDRQLRAAQGLLAESQARLLLAERALQRSMELRDSGVVSQQQFDDAETEVGAWQGRADQAKAEISRLENLIERSVVRAPFSGVVVREYCDVGEWVATGGPVVELIDLSRLEVVVNVPERHFAGARRGAVARVTFESLSDLDLEGRITAVIPQANPQTRTFPVKIELANPGSGIGIGMSATVAFPSTDERQATLVPKDAIINQGAQRIVYRVDSGPAGEDGSAGQVATAVPVVLGTRSGEWTEVSGIEPGDLIVTRGNERLMPGAAILSEPTEYTEP